MDCNCRRRSKNDRVLNGLTILKMVKRSEYFLGDTISEKNETKRRSSEISRII